MKTYTLRWITGSLLALAGAVLVRWSPTEQVSIRVTGYLMAWMGLFALAMTVRQRLKNMEDKSA